MKTQHNTSRNIAKQNTMLVQGRCSVCNGPIDKEWAGENPSIGTSCRDCPSEGRKVFGPEHVDLKVATQVVYDPLLGTHEYRISFTGTKIMVNGMVGEYISGSSFLFRLPDGRAQVMEIPNISYRLLEDFYEQNGGQMSPPELDLPYHRPLKVALLDTPIRPVTTVEYENGCVSEVKIDDWVDGYPDLPMYWTLHAFCSMFVRMGSDRFGMRQPAWSH